MRAWGILVLCISLVACAAKTEKVIPNGITGNSVQASQYSSLMLFRDKQLSQQIRMGDYFSQPGAKNYVIYQFATAFCSACQVEGRSLQNMLNSGNSIKADHFVVMVSGEQDSEFNTNTFLTQSSVPQNILLVDARAETIRQIYGGAFQVPTTVVMGRNGVSKVFKSDSNATPDHINQIVSQIQQIISQ